MQEKLRVRRKYSFFGKKIRIGAKDQNAVVGKFDNSIICGVSILHRISC